MDKDQAEGPQWISSKERLPPVGVAILAWQRYRNLYLDYRCARNGIEDWESNHGGEYVPPSHWLPLPLETRQPAVDAGLCTMDLIEQLRAENGKLKAQLREIRERSLS